MLMSDVLMWALFILGAMLMFNAYWLAAQALFPAAVARARDAYSRPMKITVLGALVAAPLVAGGIAVLQLPNPAVKILGGILLGVPILLGFAGSAGLAQKVGAGLPGPLDDAQPWRRVLRGGPILTLTCLLPFLGWFILVPWLLVSGVGALVLARVRARHSPVTPLNAAAVSTPLDSPVPAGQ
jgi:hypothetical protein